jgi:hypothetical protein
MRGAATTCGAHTPAPDLDLLTRTAYRPPARGPCYDFRFQKHCVFLLSIVRDVAVLTAAKKKYIASQAISFYFKSKCLQLPTPRRR